MIKLYSLKQHKKDGETPKSGNQKKASAAHLRITKGKCALMYLFFTESMCLKLFELLIS